ncbi:MAG TPA: HAMP domain-containing sensor histidine kinase [Caulobacteraceae bacterium]|nr:HAMP domain-containing sensor histidine kinase [Caulobacteraceae bacterium]
MRLRFRSAFSRIIWLQVLAIAATSLVMPATILVLLNHNVTAFQRRMLTSHEQALLAALHRGPDGRLQLAEPARAPYAQGGGGFAFAVVNPDGRVLLASTADGRALTPLGPRASGPAWFDKGSGRAGLYYGGVFAAEIAGRPVWIQLGQNLEDPDVVIDDITARFVPQIAWFTLAILLALLAADVAIVRRAFEPVLRASRMAEAIGPARIDVRLPLDGMPQEVAPMVQAVNQALGRLEEGFHAQRNLTADVAHELRTPLAVIRMRTEQIVDPAMRRALQADLDRMSRIVSQLLVLAEADVMAVSPDNRADLRAVGLEVAEHLAPLALAQGKSVEVAGVGRPVWVRGQHDFLFQAVRNLAENGVAHTAPGTTVTIEVSGGGVLRVLDRGPGVPLAERDLLFQRFWRRERKIGGGLGLSIVGRIVKAHGGEIVALARRGGGAVFKVVLPSASPPPAGRT